MRITEAAQRLGTSPRMLRYRERLGLLPVRGKAGSHRQFGPEELAAADLALTLEQRFGIGPAELAFGLRMLSDGQVRAAVRDLGEKIGRIPAPPRRALSFEQERALRILRGRGRQPER